MNNNVSFRFRLQHVFFHSKSARSADSAPPAVHMLEVIGSELMAQDIRVDNFGLNIFAYLNCKNWSVDYQENS